MDSDSYRLRDHQEGCAGPTSVHRAEPPGRPGRLVRLTRLTGDAAGPRTEDVVETWRALPHPSLLPISSSHRDAGGLLLVAPMASARPLDHLDTASSPLPIATLAQVGGTIAAGLEVLHAHGVVHGMVDGHTILLTSDGTSVLDGPWHPACRRRRRGRGAPVAPSGTGRAVTAAGDVRALAVTLLHHLAAVERAGTAAAGDELRALLEGQRDHPGGAAAFEAELAGWLQAIPSPSPDLSTAPPVPSPPGPRPDGHAVRSPGRWGRGRVLAAAAIAGSLVLGGAIASLRPDSIPAEATAVTADGPPTGPPAGPAQPVSAGADPGSPEEPARSRSAGGSAGIGPSVVVTRPVCPDTIAPPGPGLLLLGDLDGRGCRAAIRVHGSRLTLLDGDGRPIEVELDLRAGDQVRVGDLDGSGRDEVLVYRPASGELFRFAGLAGPGAERTATGQMTRWRGGTAVLVPSPEGADQLQVRGGTRG